MINSQIKEKIATTWSKTQQQDFYTLICKKRKQIRALIHRVRNQPH
jgi:hypothetical protein